MGIEKLVENILEHQDEIRDIRKDSKIMNAIFEEYISEIKSHNDFTTPRAIALSKELEFYRESITKTLKKIGWETF